MTLLVLSSSEFKTELLSLVPDAVGFESLPRHFTTPMSPADVMGLCSHIVEVVEEDQPIKRAEDQAVIIDSDFSAGSWPLVRTIRRRPPWDVTNCLPLPINSFYTCLRDGTGVDIYVLDTGVRTTHDEFGSRASIIYEYSPAGSDGDDNGHGTGVASCAAGVTVGFARASEIFSVKITTSSAGGATTTSLIAGLSAMLSHYNLRPKPAVANVSYTFSSSAVLSAIADAVDAGIVIVGSAGNDGVSLDSTTEFPAEAPDCIGVAGLGVLDIPAAYSNSRGTNYGGDLSICAPGQSCYIASFSSDSSYSVASGTSFASPYAAGVVACMLQGHAKLTGRSQVQAVKDKLLYNSTTGYLRIPGSSHVPDGGLPDRILYLNPTLAAPEGIPGVSE